MGTREMLSSVFHFPAGITIDSIDPNANELVIGVACDFPKDAWSLPGGDSSG